MFWSLLVLLIAVFAALAVLLRYLMTQHVTTAAAHLQELSADYAHRQEELKQQLQAAERQYEEQLTRARAEAERLMTEARQEAESLRSRRLEEARQESERIVQQGMESRDALRKELERQMEVRAIQRACELIHEALPEPFRREIQKQWLDELFRDGLAQLDRLKGEEEVPAVKVVSAFPLEAAQRQALKARVKAAFAHELPMAEEVDPKLVAGLVITIGSLVFDGSLASRIQQIVRKAHPAG
ncbi:MAG: F0F1 ATP synthase subunit delta [Candidatus Omnitrophica bacterium]|nr:F0F1 ATP synthase subunit delta [Candidatus Omnitrophota bacterium]